MSRLNPYLLKAVEEISAGKLPLRVTTREFLSWFSAQRRGYWIVQAIRRQLEEANLQTVPDFESNYIDAPLELRNVDVAPASIEAAVESVEVEPTSVIASQLVERSVSKDPTYRLSKLAPANQGILSISPDGTLAEVVTILMSRDFSQLPVMTSERDVKGIVTWQSIGSRLALSKAGEKARDFMESAQEIKSHFSIFDAIPIIVQYQYVLVRGDDQRITGIITASDLSEQFRSLSEPFLLLGEIENMLRDMIAERFSSTELQGARDPKDSEREINSPTDLAFGEYVRLLEHEERWKKFGIAIDRVRFRADLERVRLIRNDVMHFDPDGVPTDDLKNLRHFAQFLKRIRDIAREG